MVITHLLGKLFTVGVLSREDLSDVLEESLLALESHQANFPENDLDFVEARHFLEQLAKFYAQKTD